MAGSGLFRLYVGGLSRGVTEEDLQNLFEETELLPPLGVVVKPAGYAFIECPDQATFDKAIQILNGCEFMGSVIQVEPSSISKSKQTNRVQIHNVPNNATKEDIENLVKSFGQMHRCDIVTLHGEVSVYVTYETQQQAQHAVDQLNNYEFQGLSLQVDYSSTDTDSKSSSDSRGRLVGSVGGAEYPLRILVASDFVGAIIGKKGSTIRRITADCKARIDVHRENSAGLLEKVISVYGPLDNCTAACRDILEVMQNEATVTNRQEIPLKMLAEDRYCGRIIGKEGKIIKKLREDTDSKISVSNVQEVPALYPDRVITIRGTLQNICAAQHAISIKLRECYDQQLNTPIPSRMLHGGSVGHMGGAKGVYRGPEVPYDSSSESYYSQRASTSAGGATGGAASEGPSGGIGILGIPPILPTPSLGHHHYQTSQPPTAHPSFPPSHHLSHQRSSPHTAAHIPNVRDEILVMVPNSAVGALIGAGGSHIKQIIRESNAYITIEPKQDQDENPAAERVVTVKGSQQAKCKASYMIFEKLQTEGFAGSDEMRLRTAVYVPRYMVGKVIGKKGANVHELQRISGAMIKVLEDHSYQEGIQDMGGTDEYSIVEIYGNFMQTNMAQNRLRSFINQGLQTSGPRSESEAFGGSVVSGRFYPGASAGGDRQQRR